MEFAHFELKKSGLAKISGVAMIGMITKLIVMEVKKEKFVLVTKPGVVVGAAGRA